MLQLNPYLKFGGNCREAMNFYKDILGWDLSLQTLSDSPVGEQMPAPKNSIMHSTLSDGTQTIMGSDFHWDEELVNGNGTHICITCETEAEITALYNGLVQNGVVIQPLSNMPWGAMFAQVIDKYEKQWILST